MKISEVQLTSISQIKTPLFSHCVALGQKLAYGGEHVIEEELDPSFIATSVLKGNSLPRRYQRALPWLVMDSRFEDYNPKFYEVVLERFSSEANFWSKLFNAYVFYYNLDSELGESVRKILVSNKAYLNSRCDKLNNTFDILGDHPNRAKIALRILNKEIPKSLLQEVHFHPDGVSGGNFSSILFSAIAETCKNESLTDPQLESLIDLLCPQDVIHVSLRSIALVALIYGIEKKDKDSKIYILAKKIIQDNYQDPRIHLHTWPMVSEALGGEETRIKCINTVKNWHIFQSIILFFKIIEQVVKDGKNHQFPQRRDFWIKYFDDDLVTDASVVLGSEGVREAQRYKRSGDPEFATLEWSQLSGAASDQCVLLMKIGEMTILEWSHSGACRVWGKEDRRAPKFSKQQYKADELRAAVADNDKDRITHHANGQWKMDITNRINSYSGNRRAV